MKCQSRCMVKLWPEAKIADNKATFMFEAILLCFLAGVFLSAPLVIACGLQAAMSGWTRLAKVYQQSQRLGGCSVSGCFVRWSDPEPVPDSYLGTATETTPGQGSGYRLTVFDEGLQIDRNWPWAFFHPPLFVSWSDVQLTGRRRTRFEFDNESVLITFARVPDIGMHISDFAANDLLKLGIPFRASDNGTLVRVAVVDRSFT